MPKKSRLLKLKLADLDRDLLPTDARTEGTEAFRRAVSQLLNTQLRRLGGLVERLVQADDEVQITWRPGNAGIEPIIKMLQRGQYQEAMLLMQLLLSDQPDDRDLLYNLGMAYSDVGALDQALVCLRKLLALEPDHANGRIALGVALTRQQKYEEACTELSKAVALQETNPWAQRNLGACLLHLERPVEAVDHLRKATELNPADERAWFGLAQALELTGDDAGADEAYRRVLSITEIGEVAEVARQARSKIAAKNFRGAATSGLRMDAVFYCLGALERFEKMAPDDVQKVGFEIAVLGMRGLDVNDPTPKYQLKSLPGQFSGLQLVSIMYVAFKQIAPEQDVGFDLSREYEAALSLHQRKTPEG